MVVTLENVQDTVKPGVVLWAAQPGGMKPERATVVMATYGKKQLVIVSIGKKGRESNLNLHPRQLVGMYTEKSEAEKEE